MSSENQDLLPDESFADLEEQLTNFCSDCIQDVFFEPNDLIMREGAPADRFYLIKQGLVAVETHVPGRGPVRVETLGPGDLLGFSWLFPPRHWSTDARAVEPTDARAFDAKCVTERFLADPAAACALTLRMLKQMYDRLERARMQRLDVFSSGPWR